MEENESQCIMEQRLNPITGETEWVVIRGTWPRMEDEPMEKAGFSLAHTQYLDMLNDDPRNRAYDLAITKVVKPGDHILDIGAGTGLLSMIACRALAALDHSDGVSATGPADVRRRVTACESYLPMMRLARQTLRLSGMDSSIRLICKRSDEMKIGTDLQVPADVLVSEVLDSELLGEGLIPTLRHAHEHLLSKCPRTVPHRATIYGQLVECDYLLRCQDLAGVEASLGDGLVLANETESWWSGTTHVDALKDQLSLLSSPFQVFSFDFNKMPADVGVSELDVVITTAGKVHAIISWWVLELDEHATILYSTAPIWAGQAGDEGSSWRDHWKQCVWYFPGNGVKILTGEIVKIKATHDEVSVRYQMESLIKDDHRQVTANIAGEPFGLKDGMCHSLLAVRPERIGLLGDKRYRQVIKEALMKAVEGKSSPLCLVVDDSVLCSLTAALVQSDSHVVAMLPGLQQIGSSSFMKTMAKANHVNVDRIQVVGKKASQLSAGDLKGRSVAVVVAEPYYRAYEDLLPWRNLRFWYECTQLAPLLTAHPAIIPCRAILRGVAASLGDLWHSRRALTDVAGFDHSHLNQILGACGDLSSQVEAPLLPYRTWQCGQCKELTDPFSIMTFDFSLPIQEVRGSLDVPVSCPGLCHGLILWMDWILDSESQLVLSSGPSGGKPDYWKQGVKLLSTPVHLCLSSEPDKLGIPSKNTKQFSEISVTAVFIPTTGDIDVSLTTAQRRSVE